MPKRKISSAPLDFLNEKFTPAALPEIYAPRHELLNAFHRAAANKFVYVGAPAGSGKTVSTLLWLAASGRSAVWISLDGYDNTPSIFYKLLATGIYSTQPENENMRSILTDPSFSSSPVEHAISLLSELLPNDGQYALALDDMHTIDNGEVLKSLPAVLKRLPRSFVTLMLSRNNAPEEYKTLFKGEKNALITGEQLKFSEDEVRRYFSSLGRSLSQEDAKFAHMATNGWAIGINAIAKSENIELGQTGYVFENYIKTQLWDKWDKNLRAFMLNTCIADEITPELANRLTGRGDSGETLNALCAANAFVIRLNEDTYRYHHLFLDFLRGQAKASPQVNISTLYAICAVYYADVHNHFLALRYGLKSGDYKSMGSYFYSYVFENNRGAISEYVDYLQAFFSDDFPNDAFKVYPVLHVSRAWYFYMTGRHAEMEEHLDALYRSIPVIAIKTPEYMELAVLAHSLDHRTSFLTQIKRYKQFGGLIKKLSNGNVVRSIASFTQNMPYMHRSNRDYCEIVLEDGMIDRLGDTFAKLLGTEWVYAKPGLMAGFAYEKNDLTYALHEALLCNENLTDKNGIEGHFSSKVILHSILDRLGRASEADKLSEDIEALINAHAHYLSPNFKAYMAKAGLRNGDKAAAADWLDNYFITETEHPELYKIFQHFTTARAYAVLGQTSKAMESILKLKQLGTDFRRPLDVAEAGVLQAALEWALGRRAEAVATLEATLTDMQPYGFIRVIADEGASVLPVLRRVASKVNGDGYKGALKLRYVNEVSLAAYSFSKTHKGITAGIGISKKPVKLSKQQKHMLELLAQGYRISAISEMTGLAISTVKSHTSIVYGKLGVNSAMDAVLKARELGLIE